MHTEENIMTTRTRRRLPLRAALLTAALGLGAAASAQDGAAAAPAAPADNEPAQEMVAGQQVAGAPLDSGPSLEETRLSMSKWIETQQSIAKERKDWQQGKEILAGRLELIKQEVASLEEKIAQAQSNVAEADRKKAELVAETDHLKAVDKQLADTVAGMESEVRRLAKGSPECIRTRLQPLCQRIPEEGATTRVSNAERYQNVLGILNELNKANSELTVSYEVRNLSDGKPAEVQAIYVGLSQAYFVSARGEAGIGRPTLDGWTWTPSPAVAADVLMAFEILQGKHSPVFVPLPVNLK